MAGIISGMWLLEGMRSSHTENGNRCIKTGGTVSGTRLRLTGDAVL